MAEMISVREAAVRWNITERRVATLCKNGRIAGAKKQGNRWLIPADTQKPADQRKCHGNMNHRHHKRDKKYQKEYPLMEWGWSRKDCIQAIRDAGLPLPGKSSCFFCPSMKRWEIRTLYHRYPDLLRRALAIEDAAMPNLTSVRGLGRNWAWRDFICADENQLAIPGAFSDEDLPCSCCMKGELPTADL